jgi:hypothetical protein
MRPLVTDALCFPHGRALELSPDVARPTQIGVARLKNSLSSFSDSQIVALGRVLPALLCGEESSFHVFWREGCRLSNIEGDRSKALAHRIAADELEHERLLHALRSCCPVPDDEANIRYRYLAVLTYRSGGHPLLGTALARKYGDLAQLIASSLRNSTGVEEEDLSREALPFLYGELLPDSDSQNFVQRLSVLVGRQDDSVLEAIRRVEPTVRTPTAVLLDRILTSAVEGDAENGYMVPPVFRDLAKQRIHVDEQRRVFAEVAKTLLEPEGNVMRAERTISGITHSLLAGDVTNTLAWTSLLVHNALESLENPQLEVLLDRLQLVSFIKPQLGLLKSICTSRYICHTRVWIS